MHYLYKTKNSYFISGPGKYTHSEYVEHIDWCFGVDDSNLCTFIEIVNQQKVETTNDSYELVTKLNADQANNLMNLSKNVLLAVIRIIENKNLKNMSIEDSCLDSHKNPKMFNNKNISTIKSGFIFESEQEYQPPICIGRVHDKISYWKKGYGELFNLHIDDLKAYLLINGYKHVK